MNAFAYIVMFSWIPIIFFLFNRLPIRQAVIVAFIAAWLFLPLAEIKIVSGIPAFSKMSATCYGILFATIVFDVKRFSSFQFSWLDLPMLIYCITPFISSIDNGLGWYDGMSAGVAQAISWGVPYYLGRIYLNNLDGLRKLAMGILIGGLIYVPLCLYEVRTSPQLHHQLYGFSSNHFLQEIRYGGFRPEVFMESGLMVGNWMMTATLTAIWLWQADAIKQIRGWRIEWLAGVLLLTCVLVKATGALVILAVGLTIMSSAKWLRNSLIVLVLISLISVYVYNGASGAFSGDQIISNISAVDTERAGSLKVRFDNEKILSEKARQRVIFGWGGWGRNRLINHATRKDDSITDSLWIIIFGTSGAVGLISWMALNLLPVVRFVKLYPASVWLNYKVAPAAIIAILLVLYMIDCLSNAMLNPIYTVMAGALTGLVVKSPEITNKAKNLRLSFTGR